jgi:hypothetical protein
MAAPTTLNRRAAEISTSRSMIAEASAAVEKFDTPAMRLSFKIRVVRNSAAFAR